MADKKLTTGQVIGKLNDQPKRMIGQTILDGMRSGNFTFTNPLATEGGDYDQDGGGYTQAGGGNHNQGGDGDYGQSKLVNNLGRFDITDLAEIIGSIKTFER